MSKIYQGVVAWFDAVKAFGFIVDDNEDSHCVHWSRIIMDGHKTLDAGQRVEFNVGLGNNDREQAVDVRVIG